MRHVIGVDHVTVVIRLQVDLHPLRVQADEGRTTGRQAFVLRPSSFSYGPR